MILNQVLNNSVIYSDVIYPTLSRFSYIIIIYPFRVYFYFV